MNQQQLMEWNVGVTLDHLANLDVRGYGVSQILYEAARHYTGEPLSIHSARSLQKRLQSGDLVYILTGFVLLPHKKGETDGVISAVLLARALVKAFGVCPVLICPQENRKAVERLTAVAGMHFYDTIEEVKEFPASLAAICFPKEVTEAKTMTETLLEKGLPKAIIAVEAAGANRKGVYHNAGGQDVTALEAKSDILFNRCKELGVWNLAIGDLGNEIGLGTLAPWICNAVPRIGSGQCNCGCQGGILAATAADHVITATISDWGCYSLIAAIAFLCNDNEILHSAEMEQMMILTASQSGMVDMYGWLEQAIDGIGVEMHMNLVRMMHHCITYPRKYARHNAAWFAQVEEMGCYGAELKE